MQPDGASTPGVRVPVPRSRSQLVQRLAGAGVGVVLIAVGLATAVPVLGGVGIGLVVSEVVVWVGLGSSVVVIDDVGVHTRRMLVRRQLLWDGLSTVHVRMVVGDKAGPVVRGRTSDGEVRTLGGPVFTDLFADPEATRQVLDAIVTAGSAGGITVSAEAPAAAGSPG